MLRINLNLTIVAMVMPYPKSAEIAQCNVEIENSTSTVDVWINETLRDDNTSFSFPVTTLSFANVTVS